MHSQHALIRTIFRLFAQMRPASLVTHGRALSVGTKDVVSLLGWALVLAKKFQDINIKFDCKKSFKARG